VTEIYNFALQVQTQKYIKFNRQLVGKKMFILPSCWNNDQKLQKFSTTCNKQQQQQQQQQQQNISSQINWGYYIYKNIKKAIKLGPVMSRQHVLEM
jgi:hypothetical protein